MTRLHEALHSLRLALPQAEVYGIRCDVGNPSEVSLLAEFAVDQLGIVDRWLNNAGTAGLLKRPLWELHSADILETCTTNLSGSLLLCAEAVKVMDRQPSSPKAIYHIFNMGFSSSGAAFSRSAVSHKASKRGVAEVTHFLSGELKSSGKTSIGVHELSPGLVFTDLLLQDASHEAVRLFKVIAEKPETVASILAPKIRSITARNRHIRYQPFVMTFFRMLTGLPRLIGKEQG